MIFIAMKEKEYQKQYNNLFFYYVYKQRIMGIIWVIFLVVILITKSVNF